jgi:phosphatidate cytidylyltransferase
MLTRIITGAIGAVAAVGIITTGGWMFSLAVFLLSAIGWYEYHQIAAAKGKNVYYLTSGLGSLLISGFAAFAYYANIDEIFVMAFMAMFTALFFIFNAIEGLVRHCQCGETDWASNTALSMWGLIYCGVLFAHVILLRSLYLGPHIDLGFRVFHPGELLLWIVMIGTWASDIFAYFVGYFFGKTPFCSVSPKKTFEGAVGGFVGCFMVVLAMCVVCLGIPLWQGVVLGLAIAFFAPVGDLVESILKRSFDVKDSGKLFPGHGGVLDRFDSLLFTAPITYYLMLFFTLF